MGKKGKKHEDPEAKIAAFDSNFMKTTQEREKLEKLLVEKEEKEKNLKIAKEELVKQVEALTEKKKEQNIEHSNLIKAYNNTKSEVKELMDKQKEADAGQDEDAKASIGAQLEEKKKFVDDLDKKIASSQEMFHEINEEVKPLKKNLII